MRRGVWNFLFGGSLESQVLFSEIRPKLPKSSKTFRIWRRPAADRWAVVAVLVILVHYHPVAGACQESLYIHGTYQDASYKKEVVFDLVCGDIKIDRRSARSQFSTLSTLRNATIVYLGTFASSR